MYETTNRGKLLKHNSNHFSNKMYLETLQIGERYGINALHIRIGIKHRQRESSPVRDTEAPFTVFVLFLAKGFNETEREPQCFGAR